MTKSNPCRGQDDLPSWCSVTTQETSRWPPILTINPAAQNYRSGRFCDNLTEITEPLVDDDDNDETMIMAQALFQSTRAMLRNTNRNQQRRREEQEQVSDAIKHNDGNEAMLFLPPVGTDSLDLFLAKRVEQEESCLLLQLSPPTAKKPRGERNSDCDPGNDARSVSSYDSLKYHHRRLDEAGYVPTSETGKHRQKCNNLDELSAIFRDIENSGEGH